MNQNEDDRLIDQSINSIRQRDGFGQQKNLGLLHGPHGEPGDKPVQEEGVNHGHGDAGQEGPGHQRAPLENVSPHQFRGVFLYLFSNTTSLHGNKTSYVLPIK